MANPFCIFRIKTETINTTDMNTTDRSKVWF